MSKYFEKINKLPQINLQNLYDQIKSSKKKKKQDTKTKFYSDHNNANMNVTSPFCMRNSCSKKHACKCPYHKRQRIQNAKIKNSCHFEQKVCPKYFGKKMLTQNSQGKIQQVKNYLKKLNIEEDKFKIGNYNALHKVECHNYEFQEYLKKNNLYILNGKNKHNRFQSEGKQYQSTLRQQTQMQQNFEKAINKKKKNRKTSRLSTKTIKEEKLAINFDQLLHKTARQRLQFYEELKKNLLSRNKFESSQQIENQIRQIQVLLEEEELFRKRDKENNSENIEILKSMKKILMSVLRKFSDRDQIKIYEKKKHIRQKSKCINFSESKKKMLFQIGNLSDSQLSDQNYKNYEKSHVRIKDQQTVINFNQKSQISIKGSLENIPSEKFEESEKKTVKRIITKKNRRTFFSKLDQHDEENGQLHDQKNDEKQQSKNTSKEFKNIRKSKWMGQNLKMKILQEIKQKKVKEQQSTLRNFKSNIQKNKILIKKIKVKLKQTELQRFLILQTDSYITRKKKMRCLKQYLLKRKQQFEGTLLYEQIIDYLNIYTQYNDQLMKNSKTASGKEDENEEMSVQMSNLFNKKDYRNSLKFIELQQCKPVKESKIVQGWIQIPQFVTYDNNKKKTKLVAIQKVDEKQKVMEVENEKDDDLVQVELPDRFSLLDEHDIEDLTFLKMRRKKKEFKKSKSSLSIQESIYFYKQKFLNKWKTEQ